MTPVAARQTVTTALLVGTAVLAAACGSASLTANGQSSSPPSSSPAAPASTPSSSPAAPSPLPSSSSPGTPAAAATQGCATSGLKVVVNTAQAGAAAGSTYYPIKFTNTSGSTCTLFGYPGVSFSSGPGGDRIGRAASRNPAGKPVTVTLASGASAHATVQIAEAANYSKSSCKPVAAHWLKVYPPNQVKPVFVSFTTQACSAMLPRSTGGQLSIYAMRPGPGKSGQAP
jgi:uncharacterized protein DUF4232